VLCLGACSVESTKPVTLEQEQLQNQIIVSPDPDTKSAFVEADGRNGLDEVAVNVYTEPANSGAWPDFPGDCLGDAAETELTSGVPSSVRRWFVRMPDPYQVMSVGERYFLKLDSGLDWHAEDWPDAQAEWRADRAAATAIAEADLTAAMSGTSCVLKDVIGVMPFAVVECTVADAGALWSAGAVECLELDDVTGNVEVGADGHDWLADRQADQFLPNPYDPVPSYGSGPGTGYTPGKDTWLAVVAEDAVPPWAGITHNHFDDGSSTTRLYASEGCTLVGTRTRCDTGRAASVVDSGGSGLIHSLIVGGQLWGSAVDGQAFPVTSSPTWSSAEQTSAPAREVKGKFVGFNTGMSRNYAALADRMSELRPVAVNVSAASWVGTATDCDGQGGRQEAIAQMFEQGIPFFGLAHNWDNPDRYPAYDGRDCNIGRPMGALAAFVSGGLDDNEDRWEHSGHADHGGRRTVVDGMSQAETSVGFDVSPPNSTALAEAGTSLSSPLTASLALVYRHHYEALPGNPTFIRVPDVLYTRLLLQGDRQGQSGPDDDDTVWSLSSGFDWNWGSGRLNLEPVFTRDYNPMSSTWMRNSLAGRVCLADDTTVEIPIPQVGAVGGPTEVNFVARFHDKRHATRGHLDELRLQLAKVTSPTSRDLIIQDLRPEEKLRVHAQVQPGTYVVRIIGIDVDADDENGTCPFGERLVYWAYEWE